MQKVLSTILLLVSFALMPIYGSVHAEDYFVYEHFGDGQWHDVEKANLITESQFCWAAAASNILAWGGWGTAEYSKDTDIYKSFVDSWTNGVGTPKLQKIGGFMGYPPRIQPLLNCYQLH